ncbi:adenine nucleotide alpha hydrolase [Pararhizobium sp. BT-229]|uniref:adenine nucleotide alpha hydrolase n=1 Tax=Pararhizobium sp. BT-229 TaxID=2986923 RepID=UPI0021F7F74D|nr:adenine nucleotide alpha hydrolase [Pararhizobium sp. BT-229]MCV9963269.1 adenine nucleotide alpha hydrolase [Pararhizobium sp. BT-229]
MTDALRDILFDIGPATVAVSGGVDSMTLAVLAHRSLGRNNVTMMHAASAAVPAEATQRVRHWAAAENWDLRVIDAGELSDEKYRSNPLNRCFFCKGNLYGTISDLTDRQILSGANTDDLGEYRPGLDAARQYSVRHPYLEARIDKGGVRALARALGLGDLSDLPASPCLSSRVETLIRIEPETLQAIHAVENLVSDRLSPRTVRCRIRQAGIVVELDAGSLNAADAIERSALTASIARLLPQALAGKTIAFAPYRNGSAFVGDKQ